MRESKVSKILMRVYGAQSHGKGVETKQSRIKDLKPNEIGFLHIANFKQDGVAASAKKLERYSKLLWLSLYYQAQNHFHT